MRRVLGFFESPFFHNLPVIPDAADGLRALKSAFRLVVVTSRQTAIEAETRAWLLRHYPDTFDDVAFGNHYGLEGAKKYVLLSCR